MELPEAIKWIENFIDVEGHECIPEMVESLTTLIDYVKPNLKRATISIMPGEQIEMIYYLGLVIRIINRWPDKEINTDAKLAIEKLKFKIRNANTPDTDESIADMAAMAELLDIDISSISDRIDDRLNNK